MSITVSASATASSNSNNSVFSAMCCTTCGIPLQEQTPNSGVGNDDQTNLGSEAGTDAGNPTKNFNSQPERYHVWKPKRHFSKFDQKFLVDPIKFYTAVTYFLPRGLTDEIQDAIASYQLPFCPECIDVIDRICSIESEIDNLYQLMDSLITFFKYRVQLTVNTTGTGTGSESSKAESSQAEEGQNQDSGPDESIWKMRASIVGLKTWKGAELYPNQKEPQRVKFQIPAKGNKSTAKSKSKPSQIRTLSPQLMNKKREYRESVIKKIRTKGSGEDESGSNSNSNRRKNKKQKTTTMHYDYLAISSDSNSSVELNTPPRTQSQSQSVVDPENPDAPTQIVDTTRETHLPRKSPRIESKETTSSSSKAKNKKYGEDFVTNLDGIVSGDEEPDEVVDELGEEEEEEDKEWDENDELVDGEGDLEDEEEDEEDVEIGSEEDDDPEPEPPEYSAENDDAVDDGIDANPLVSDKVMRYRQFRELKLKKEEMKNKKPRKKRVQKFAVTDVGDGTFEYKDFKITKQNEDKFQCSTCNKIFKARANVIAHINLKHLEQNSEQKSSPSSKNKLQAKRKTDRRQRQVTQLADNVYQFEGLTFSIREDGRYQCGTCPNTLKTRDSVLVHIKQRHLGEGLGKFLCFQCGKSFDRDVYLKLHEVTHSANKKLHQCSTCGKTFTQISNLYNHRKIHTGELNHHCTIEGCGKKFLTRKQLTVHTKRHLGDRPYECDLCPKKFVRSSELVIHMRSHSEERPYECRLCESKFFIKYRLNRHLKKVHHIDEPVVIVEGGDAPIRIISTTSLHGTATAPGQQGQQQQQHHGVTASAHVSNNMGHRQQQHLPVNVTLDPQNPLHHFLSLTDLF